MISVLNLNCNSGHRIRILDSFYSSFSNLTYLVPSEQLTAAYENVNLKRKRNLNNNPMCNENTLNSDTDCRMTTDLKNSNCNGKQTCSIQFYEQFLSECNSKSNYLTVLYECVPGII